MADAFLPRSAGSLGLPFYLIYAYTRALLVLLKTIKDKNEAQMPQLAHVGDTVFVAIAKEFEM